MPLLTGDASTVNTSWSCGRGMVSVCGCFRALCTCSKILCSSGVQSIKAEPVRPLVESSKGLTSDAYFGIHCERALNAPRKDLILVHVFGGSHAASGAILWELALKVPARHTQPNVVIFSGHIKVLMGDILMLFSLHR